MIVDVKINITIQTDTISTSVIMGPSDMPLSPLEEMLKKLEWPYRYSTDSALLPIFTPCSELAGAIT